MEREHLHYRSDYRAKNHRPNLRDDNEIDVEDEKNIFQFYNIYIKFRNNSLCEIAR